jgi:Serine hydrolase (FSH1)
LLTNFPVRRVDQEAESLVSNHDTNCNPSMEKLRVLCLHGYHGSARVLRRQLAPLAEGLDDLVEFVYVNAPALAAGDFGW